MRDELLEDNMFEDLSHARALITAWSRRYNEEHPHSALGWLSPNQYARQWAQHHHNNQQPSQHPVHKTRPGQGEGEEFRRFSSGVLDPSLAGVRLS